MIQFILVIVSISNISFHSRYNCIVAFVVQYNWWWTVFQNILHLLSLYIESQNSRGKQKCFDSVLYYQLGW